jgi:hypothetical protein
MVVVEGKFVTVTTMSGPARIIRSKKMAAQYVEEAMAAWDNQPALKSEHRYPERNTSTSICQDCGGPNPVWFAPTELWNLVMSPDGEVHTGDPGGIVCLSVLSIALNSLAYRMPDGSCAPRITIRLSNNRRIPEADGSALV